MSFERFWEKQHSDTLNAIIKMKKEKEKIIVNDNRTLNIQVNLIRN